MPTININGANIFYQDDGDKSLEPILCLHSLFLDNGMFDEFVSQIKNNYRVIRPDFRGQGQSDVGNTDIITMEALAKDVEAFIEVLGLSSVHAVVQSMGGDVIARVAIMRPDLIKSLVLLGTSVRDEPPEQLAFVESFLADVETFGFTGEPLDTLVAIMFGETTRSTPEKSAFITHWKNVLSKLPITLLPSMKGVVHRRSVVDDLGCIRAPSLVISGAEDMVRPGEWADQMAHGLSNVKHIRMPRVGHSVILEAPSETISEIKLFLDNSKVLNGQAID